ncbi:MAG: hypothetical protein C0434_10855 [Xanthomonadaceae bacterium]|nr:hypothetical protein [Xanthomonadaceae bacterium]
MSGARKLHRALAWTAAVAAVVWAASGAFHPLITAIGPKPVAFQPPVAQFEAGAFPAPARLLAQAGIAEARQLRYLAVDGRAALQVQPVSSGERLYLDAASGQPLADADRQRAIALARHYSGRADAAVAETRLVEQFERDYPWINRLLPVWAVRFAGDDAITVYVDTGGDRLGTLSDAGKRRWQGLFQTLHTLNFIELPYLRVIAISLLVGTLGLTAAFGARLLLGRGGRQPARRWHRRLAWIAVLPALLFPATGLFKLWVGQIPGTPLPVPPTLATSTLTALPFTAADGAIREAVAVPLIGGAPVWRVVAPRGEALNLWLSEADGSAIAGDDEALARRIASGALGSPPAAPLTLVTAFDRDYGFANKRLPVWRAVAADGSGWYVETRSGVVAAKVGGPDGALDQAQALVFNLLHKGHVLDPLGVTPNQRNVVMSALAATVVLVALFGIALRRRATRHRETV